MGKHRRPLLAASEKTSDLDGLKYESGSDTDDKDDIEEFVTNRHLHMAQMHGLDDSDSDDVGNEPELTEQDVLNLHASDSDESNSDDSDILDEEHEEHAKAEEKGDWGGKRRNWYGGDTHDYEIMGDDEREEILQDEEEEAIRLQKKALHRTRPEDYVEDENDDSQEDPRGEDDNHRQETEPIADLNMAAPELSLLAREFEKSFSQLAALKESGHWDEIDRIKYQLLGLFVTNVALYFSLRTDPGSVGIDLRTHPVLSRIVQIRSLLRNTKYVLREQPTNGTVADELGNGEREDNIEQAITKLLQNAQEGERNTIERAETQQRQHKEKRKKRKRKRSEGGNTIAADEERVLKFLKPIRHDVAVEDEQTIKEKKRRKLNKIVGAMERERKNSDAKRMVSADLDLVREEVRSAKPHTDNHDHGTYRDDEVDAADPVDDDQVMKRMLAKREKKQSRKARKAAASAPHVYTFNDKVHPDQKRKASTQVVKNRGLTRFRPRDKKTPRTKNRLAYGKAVIRRKGAVREFTGAHGGSYGGEASGINMSARKSSML